MAYPGPHRPSPGLADDRTRADVQSPPQSWRASGDRWRPPQGNGSKPFRPVAGSMVARGRVSTSRHQASRGVDPGLDDRADGRWMAASPCSPR